ncbi:MAG: ATP-binding cassette domain-containing protein, partial [Euryarchaeota archaeon]|nr:ATP-binding cassette domain-containing protein [Euryarchaeota archaeon]
MTSLISMTQESQEPKTGVPALHVHSLSTTFGGQTVLDRVSFSVAKGECLTVVGPSGAGKSVLLKSLNRLIEPSEGKIELFGTNIARFSLTVPTNMTGTCPTRQTLRLRSMGSILAIFV